MSEPSRCRPPMSGRALSFVVPALMIFHAPGSDAAAVASGRNWRISIEAIECESAQSLVVVGTHIHYLGPKGPVEAPVSQLVDESGRQYFPGSLVWRGGNAQLARWLSSGGLTNVQSEYVGEVQLKFGVRGAAGDLKLEFGDIKAFALTRKRRPAAGSACEGLLKPGQVHASRASRASKVEESKFRVRVYRAAYPCIAQPGSLRTTEAEYPPHVPRQLLFLGRGYLPNARQIELPMGKAPAQSYAYVGVDDLNAVEDAARRAISADFPAYRASLVTMPAQGNPPSGKYFAFNWGAQKAQSGNEAYSIGIYDLRPCVK